MAVERIQPAKESTAQEIKQLVQEGNAKTVNVSATYGFKYYGTPGSHSFTPPPGVRRIWVTIQGAAGGGGGGGGGASGGSGSRDIVGQGGSGGGGGSGAPGQPGYPALYLIRFPVTLYDGSTVPITVGAGGTGGQGGGGGNAVSGPATGTTGNGVAGYAGQKGQNGNPGGVTSIGNYLSVLGAPGGAGGGGGSPGTGGFQGGTGGGGGASGISSPLYLNTSYATENSTASFGTNAVNTENTYEMNMPIVLKGSAILTAVNGATGLNGGTSSVGGNGGQAILAATGTNYPVSGKIGEILTNISLLTGTPFFNPAYSIGGGGGTSGAGGAGGQTTSQAHTVITDSKPGVTGAPGGAGNNAKILIEWGLE